LVGVNGKAPYEVVDGVIVGTTVAARQQLPGDRQDLQRTSSSNSR